MDMDDRIDRPNSEKITLLRYNEQGGWKIFVRELWFPYTSLSPWFLLLLWLCLASKIEEGHHCSQYKYQMIRDDHCTKKYFTYLQFPFLFLLLFFHPVYGLASFISLCTPLTTVLLLLRSIHLGWCFPLSPITMATAAVGCHWSLYNIPREAKAKTVDKKKEKRKERVRGGMNGLRSGWCVKTVIAADEWMQYERENKREIRDRSSIVYEYKAEWGTARASREQGASTGAAHCTRDNMSN